MKIEILGDQIREALWERLLLGAGGDPKLSSGCIFARNQMILIYAMQWTILSSARQVQHNCVQCTMCTKQNWNLKCAYLLLVLAQHTQTHNVPCAKYWFGRIKGYEWEWAADLGWRELGAHIFIYICTLVLYCIVLYTWVDGGWVHMFIYLYCIVYLGWWGFSAQVPGNLDIYSSLTIQLKPTLIIIMTTEIIWIKNLLIVGLKYSLVNSWTTCNGRIDWPKF